MRANRSFLFPLVAIAILPAVAFTLSSVVASARLRSESQRSATAANSSAQANQVQVLNAGLWRTDRGFNATIRVTNLLVVGPLEVVPVLYMADGTRYELSPLKLPTSGESNVSVNEALRSAPTTVAAHLSEFGSASLEYRHSFPGVASATVEILDVPRSLIFTYCFGPSGGTPGPHTVEGVWWKHDPDITGFVGLANTTSHALEADLALVDADGEESTERSFTLDSRTVKLVDLEEMWERLPSRPKGRGGIRVRYEGASGDLLITGGLQNDAIGYSATIPFLFRESAPVEVAPHTYASVGMMIGKPDPMMGFPATTRFAPYAVIRNTTEDRLSVTSSIVYTNNGQPVTVPLPLKPLRPLSTEEIDLKALMAASGLRSFDGMINLTFAFNGRPGDLLISTGSVDQTGTYVFAVQPEAAKISAGKEIAFWSVADGSDTMISLWNPLNAAQNMAVTFHYADGSGEYRLPVHLPAKVDTMISVAELKMMGRPDLNGKTFSATAQEGSATVTNLADPHGDLTVVVNAGTFNVQTATCGGGCTLCSGLTSVIVSGAGSVAVGSTTQFSATAYYSSGSSGDVTFGASWTTSNSSIANVNAAGVVSGVSPGSAWITASYDGRLGGVCPVPPTYDGGCPTGTVSSDPQSVTVKPTISGPNTLWWFNGLGAGVSGYATQITLTASSGGTGTSYQWAITAGSDKSIDEYVSDRASQQYGTEYWCERCQRNRHGEWDHIRPLQANCSGPLHIWNRRCTPESRVRLG
jgi:hypothetical protein